MEPLTDEQRQRVDLALMSLNSFVPNPRAIRETLESIRGVDPKAAYEHFLKSRPKDWPTLPPFETLMEK